MNMFKKRGIILKSDKFNKEFIDFLKINFHSKYLFHIKDIKNSTNFFDKQEIIFVINIENTKDIYSIKELNDSPIDVLFTLSEYFCGSEIREDADIILSTYEWNNSFDLKDVKDHFIREKTMYDFVAFSDVVHEKNSEFSGERFVFIGIFNHPDSLTSLYEGENIEFLSNMREHSKTFVKINTRELMFSKVNNIE